MWIHRRTTMKLPLSPTMIEKIQMNISRCGWQSCSSNSEKLANYSHFSFLVLCYSFWKNFKQKSFNLLQLHFEKKMFKNYRLREKSDEQFEILFLNNLKRFVQEEICALSIRCLNANCSKWNLFIHASGWFWYKQWICVIYGDNSSLYLYVCIYTQPWPYPRELSENTWFLLLQWHENSLSSSSFPSN